MREAADAIFEFIRMPDSTGFGNFTVDRKSSGYEIKKYKFGEQIIRTITCFSPSTTTRA